MNYFLCECTGDLHPAKDHEEFASLFAFKSYCLSSGPKFYRIVNKDCPYTEFGSAEIIAETRNMLLIKDADNV